MLRSDADKYKHHKNGSKYACCGQFPAYGLFRKNSLYAGKRQEAPCLVTVLDDHGQDDAVTEVDYFSGKPPGGSVYNPMGRQRKERGALGVNAGKIQAIPDHCPCFLKI